MFLKGLYGGQAPGFCGSRLVVGCLEVGGGGIKYFLNKKKLFNL